MDKIKNYVIAILTGLLALSLFTQPAQSAGKSKEAKQVEYEICLKLMTGAEVSTPQLFQYEPSPTPLDRSIKKCESYRP